MQQIVINEADLLDLARQRRSLLSGSLDTKREGAWDQYGYPETLDFATLYKAYKRTGAGQGAVHRLLAKCWQETPRIKQPKADKETRWETDLKALLDGIKGWQKLRDFDRRNLVGRYAGLILRVADGKALSEPLARAEKLVDLIPVYGEQQLKVMDWHSDSSNPDTFGKPRMFQYRARALETSASQQARPEKWADVHPSRVIILAEGSVGEDFMEGVPLLEAGYNQLVDLEKIAGGAGEGFLKNSQRTVVFKFDANSSPVVLTNNPDGTQGSQPMAKVLEEKTQALNRNIDASIGMAGGDAHTLQTQQADPKPAFEVAANLFAASVQIPFTILFGQQTGRLASDEDKADFIARARARQVNELTPMLRELITRLQGCGAVAAGDFEIEWPPLDAPGDTEKLDNATKMAAINKADTEAGGGGVFDENEIRKAAGYEEKTGLDELPGEGLDDPEADPGQEPPAQPPAPRAVRAANEASFALRLARWLRLAA